MLIGTPLRETVQVRSVKFVDTVTVTKDIPLMNFRILVALNRLDHDPREDEGEDKAGATGRPPGDGLPFAHGAEFESCLVMESRLKLK